MTSRLAYVVCTLHVYPKFLFLKVMKESGAPHDKGITYEKFCEHRGYA